MISKRNRPAGRRARRGLIASYLTRLKRYPAINCDYEALLAAQGILSQRCTDDDAPLTTATTTKTTTAMTKTKIPRPHSLGQPKGWDFIWTKIKGDAVDNENGFDEELTNLRRVDSEFDSAFSRLRTERVGGVVSSWLSSAFRTAASWKKSRSAVEDFEIHVAALLPESGFVATRVSLVDEETKINSEIIHPTTSLTDGGEIENFVSRVPMTASPDRDTDCGVSDESGTPNLPIAGDDPGVINDRVDNSRISSKSDDDSVVVDKSVNSFEISGERGDDSGVFNNSVDNSGVSSKSVDDSRISDVSNADFASSVPDDSGIAGESGVFFGVSDSFSPDFDADAFLRDNEIAIVLEIASDSFLDQYSDCHQLLLTLMDQLIEAYEDSIDIQCKRVNAKVASGLINVNDPRLVAEALFRSFWTRLPNLEALDRKYAVYEGNAFFSVNEAGCAEMVTLKEYLRATLKYRLCHRK